MPSLNTLAKIVAKPIPRMVTPKAHAVIDYASVGLFLGTAAWLWRRNRRAAVASLVCGSTELAMVLLTDYPGGINKMISFRTHREIDYGLTRGSSSGFRLLSLRCWASLRNPLACLLETAEFGRPEPTMG